MTKKILISVAAGVLIGLFLIPEKYGQIFLERSDTWLVIGLCVLLFFVGIDLGMDGTVVGNFKKVGWRIAVIPFATIAGTMAGVAAASLFLPVTIREGMAVGAGFGWYSLAPVILSKYSAGLSAVSFIHNILREMIAIVLIPVVAKRVGYVETCCLPGAAAMDVCLPVVEKATNANIAVYSFVSGVVLSIAVPVMVPLIAGI